MSLMKVRSRVLARLLAQFLRLMIGRVLARLLAQLLRLMNGRVLALLIAQLLNLISSQLLSLLVAQFSVLTRLQVPTLEFTDSSGSTVRISESIAIIEFLEDLLPNQVGSAKMSARSHSLSYWLEKKVAIDEIQEEKAAIVEFQEEFVANQMITVKT